MTTSDRGQRPGLFISGSHVATHNGSQIYFASSLISVTHAGAEHLPRGPGEGRGDRDQAEEDEQSQANVL